ncbi:MAG: phage tail protein [Chitinophagaceae bacterium]
MAASYPPVSFFFRVDFQLGGVQSTDSMFQEVSGFNAELQTEEIKAGGENRYSQVLPVRAKYTDLVLKRGLIVDSAVVNWCRDAIENLIIRPITVTVKLLNEKNQPLLTYNIVNAWPKKWSVSDFNAQESKIVVETLELSYQYFRVNS